MQFTELTLGSPTGYDYGSEATEPTTELVQVTRRAFVAGRCGPEIMTRINDEAIKQLSISERVRLVQEIWDSLRPEADRLPLTEEQKELVDRRVEEHREDPDSAVSWREVEARLESDQVPGYSIRLRPQVEGEVREAMAWYRHQVPGLEQDLYGAFLEGIAAAYRKVRGEVRRIVLKRFPYVLFFLVEGQVDPPDVFVLALVHERRSPDRWPTG